MSKKWMGYCIVFGFSQAFSALPLEFSHSPQFPITLDESQSTMLQYTVRNNVSVALPLTISVSPTSRLEVNPLTTTCGQYLLPPNHECRLNVRLNAGNTVGMYTGDIKIDYQGRSPLQSKPIVNVRSASATGVLQIGYNLSGFEFSTTPTPSLYPTTTDAATFAGTFGAKMIRLPFRMEYCTDIDGNINNPSYLVALNDYLQTLLLNNTSLQVLLDMHDYMRYCPGQQAGNCSQFLTSTQLSQAWVNIVNALSAVKNNPNVYLDLMNEPNGISASNTFDREITAFISLREHGISNPIVLEGTAWTGLHSWESSGNAAVFTKTAIDNALQLAGVEPLQYAIEVHQYLDSNFSGTSPVCVDPTTLNQQINFSEFQAWLQSNALPVILGETGGGLNQVCIDDMSLLYQDIANNPFDASSSSGGFSAITYWGGGQAWGNSYFLGIEPLSSLNTTGMTKNYAAAQLYLTLTQLQSENTITPLMSSIPTEMFYSFGMCDTSLFTIDLTNDLPSSNSTGNIQFRTGQSTVDAPMSTSLQNIDNTENQKETVCLPKSATQLYIYPGPSYQQKYFNLSAQPIQNYVVSEALDTLVRRQR